MTYLLLLELVEELAVASCYLWRENERHRWWENHGELPTSGEGQAASARRDDVFHKKVRVLRIKMICACVGILTNRVAH
jgi:hypothetical protein